jgi:hypothetical protein
VLNASTVLAPVFVQVLLTLGLLTWMVYLRVTVLRRGEVHARDVALGQPNWPLLATQVSNAYRNQLELPVLFYALIALALVTATASMALVVLSWVFVVLRLAHALIHVTTNRLSRRFFLFVAGGLVLLIMWIIFAWRIYFGV